MGKRVKKALANFAAQAATGDPAAVAQYAAERSAYNRAQSTKLHGFQKLKPKHVAALTKNSILNPKILVKDVGDTARAGLHGSFQQKRANLRAHHEKTIHPFNNISQDIVRSDSLKNSHNPAEVSQGVLLRESADIRSMRNGKIGAAVGVAFLGASALGGSGASAGTGIGGSGVSYTTATKYVVGAAEFVAKRRATEKQTGLTDTSNSNGDGYSVYNGAPNRGGPSQWADAFFSGLGPAAAGGGAASCGMTGHGAPLIFCIGLGLFSVGLIYRWVRHVSV